MTHVVIAGLTHIVIAGLTGNLRAHENGPYGVPGLKAVFKLTPALHHKKPLLPPRPGFLLQQKQILDLGILGRCNGLHLEFLRAHHGEEQDILDAVLSGHEHCETVYADTDTGGGRHAVLKGADEVVVNVHGFIISL